MLSDLMISRSPDRGAFQKENYLRRQAEEGRTPDNDKDVQAMADYFDTSEKETMEKELDPAWKQNNMEYDLRTCDWMLAKVRTNEAYAQNLYAAMCNRTFQKNDVWPTLKGQVWSCSWRYAGGIIADMCEEGDYIDWYCSGIRGGAREEDLAAMTEEQRAKYYWYQENFVSESVVTDEIRKDLFELGWIVLDDDIDIS